MTEQFTPTPRIQELSPENLGAVSAATKRMEELQAEIDNKTIPPINAETYPQALESQSTDSITTSPLSNSPEMTTEERIKRGKALIEEDAAMIYDLANPENIRFSPEQEKNNEIMEGLPEKYPHAFVERSTDDGRKYLLLKQIYMETSSLFNEAYSDSGCIDRNKALMLSYRGVSVIDFIYDPAKYDFTQVLDQEQRILYREPISGFSRDIDIDIKKLQEYNNDSNPEVVLCYKFESKDFADVNLEILKKIFVDMEQEHKDDIVKEKPTAKKILDSL